MFGDTPSSTNLIEHDIDVGDARPIQSFFRVSEEEVKITDSEMKCWIILLLSSLLLVGRLLV